MTNFIESPRSDISQEEFQLWLERLTRVVNENGITGEGGGGGDVDVNRLVPQANGEVINSIDNTLYGYLRRFLHFRFASDEDGNNQITDLSTFTGDTLYVGTFNNNTTTVPANANFVYRPNAWSAGQHFIYRVTGGGRILMAIQGSVPTGFQELTDAGTVDLDVFGGTADGATGDGFLQLSVFRRSATAPDAPMGGSYNFDTNVFVAPMDWSEDVPAGTEPAYRSVAVVRAPQSAGTINIVGWTEPTIAFRNGEDGAPGDDGDTPVAYYSENALNNRPASHPGINPGPWTREDIAAARPTDDFNWIIWGFERGDPTAAEYTLQAVGSAGQATSQGGLTEQGNIVVDANAMVNPTGAPVGALPEITDITVAGDTGTPPDPGDPSSANITITGNSGNDSGQTEIQEFTFSGSTTPRTRLLQNVGDEIEITVPVNTADFISTIGSATDGRIAFAIVFDDLINDPSQPVFRWEGLTGFIIGQTRESINESIARFAPYNLDQVSPRVNGSVRINSAVLNANNTFTFTVEQLLPTTTSGDAVTRINSVNMQFARGSSLSGPTLADTTTPSVRILSPSTATFSGQDFTFASGLAATTAATDFAEQFNRNTTLLATWQPATVNGAVVRIESVNRVNVNSGNISVNSDNLMIAQNVVREGIAPNPNFVFSAVSINGTSISLGNNRTTQAELQQAFVTAFNGNTTLQASFLPATIANNVITITTRVNTDANIAVVGADNGGDITVTSVVTRGTPDPAFTASTITIFAAFRTGSVAETLQLTQGLTSQAAIAADVVRAFNSNSALQAFFTQAEVNNNNVRITSRTNEDINVGATAVDNNGDITVTTNVVQQGTRGSSGRVESFSFQNIAGTTGTAANPTTIRIVSGALDETLTLGPGISGDDISLNMADMFNANTNLLAVFQRGLSFGDIFVFRAINFGDIPLMVTVGQGDGNITFTTNAIDGEDAIAQPIVRPVIQVNFDSGRDIPTETSITLSASNNASDIAALVAQAINAHGAYTASVNLMNNRQVDYQAVNEGTRDNITITVPTTGDSNITPGSFTVTVTQQGNDPTIVGSPGSYTVVINGVTNFTGTLIGSSAAQVIDTIRGVINGDGTFAATETSDTALRITAAPGFASLAVTTDAGSGNLITTLTQVTAGSAGGFTPISSINQFLGTPGADGADGDGGAGWYRVITALTQQQLDALNNAQLDILYRTEVKPDIVAFDRLIIAGLAGAVRAVVRDTTNSIWEAQAQFIDGNLLVAGTVTAGSIAADVFRSTNFDGTVGSPTATGTVGWSLPRTGTIAFNSDVHFGGDIVGPGSIRQGIVVDSESVYAGGTGNTLASTETFTTKDHVSDVVLFGAASTPVMLTNTGADRNNVALEVQMGTGAFQRVFTHPDGFGINFGMNAVAGQAYNSALYFAHTLTNVPANTQLTFRVVQVGTALPMAGWGWGMSIIEEKNVTA